jgi:hypothetical protein
MLIGDAVKRASLQVLGLSLTEFDAAHDRERLARPHFLSELRDQLDHPRRDLVGNFRNRAGVGFDDCCGG